jgi:hypothetical protein
MDALIDHANYYWSLIDMTIVSYNCADYCIALRNALYAISREVCELDAKNISIDRALLMRAHKIARNACNGDAKIYMMEYTICALDLTPLFLSVIERERLSICTLMSTAAVH